MYAHFYHLAESPFNLTPDPKFQYVNDSTREAMASLLHGIRSRKGFITLIAEAGTGKTTMLKRIVDEIEGETQVVFVFNPGVSFDELLEFICMELGIRTDSSKRLHLLERLNGFLLQQLTEGRNVVVMIDEAQTLEESVLEELRLLSNLETAKEKILQMVLSGQPELEDKLRKPQLRQLRQRIGVRCTLKPMQPSEIGAYVETRLRSAGADRADFFTPVGLRKVWQASKGIPRVINAICDNAMMIAFAEGKQRIDSGVVNEAVRDLHGGDASGDFGSKAREWISHPYARYAAAAVLAMAFLVPSIGNLIDVWKGIDDAPAEQVASLPSDAQRVPSTARIGAERAAASIGEIVEVPKVLDAEPVKPVLAAAAESRRDREPSKPAVEPKLTGTSSDPIVAAARAAAVGEAVEEKSESNATVHSAAVLASIRRAELLARSTAARIYDGRRRSLEESAAHSLNEPSPKPVKRVAPEAGESLVEVVGSRRDQVGDDGFEADFDMESEETLAMIGNEPEPAPEPKQQPAKRDTDNDAAVAASAAKEAAREAEREAERTKAAVAEDAENARELSQAVEKLAAAASTLAVAVEDGSAKSTAKEEEKESPEAVEERSPIGRLAALEAGIETLGPDSGGLIVGRHVRVQPGDTLWDIAIGYYGTAGESALTRILNNNPGIRDPRRLLVGAHVYLPFQRAARMVHADSDDTYRVLLTVSPKRSALEETRAWIKGNGETVQLGTATVEGTETLYHLYAIGIRNRRDALALAERVLAMHAVSDRGRQTV